MFKPNRFKHNNPRLNTFNQKVISIIINDYFIRIIKIQPFANSNIKSILVYVYFRVWSVGSDVNSQLLNYVLTMTNYNKYNLYLNNNNLKKISY